ncbi:MAG: deoxyribose-phosphate aldolase [Oscillospiraceae bacterium]|nr:deoxyribose-phosphate aldolase [Oscillospiraceae bacterium]
MDVYKLLKHCDHTLLRQDATGEEIMTLCDEGMRYGVASVCIPPCHVAGASRYVKGKLPICTVVGFPNGYSTSRAKAFEAQEAIQNGASEIDMVANLAMIKDACWDDVLQDIKTVRDFTQGHILKVIIETCLLTEDEKRIMCAVVSASGANYIKTSTGFSTGGATREDVQLLRSCCDSSVKVKASGGIATLQDGEDFLALGADRLGTSRLVKLAIEMEKGAASSAAEKDPAANEPGQGAAGNA